MSIYSRCVLSFDWIKTNMILTFQTLTGKEIEIDIEPTDKVMPWNEQWTKEKLVLHIISNPQKCFVCWRWSESKNGWKRRKGSPLSNRDSSTVENRCELSRTFLKRTLVFLDKHDPNLLSVFVTRNDEKTAADYKIQGGSVLHLVLALRGGTPLHRPGVHFTSSSWAAVVTRPAECQGFGCLSSSDHITAQRSKIRCPRHPIIKDAGSFPMFL